MAWAEKPGHSERTCDLGGLRESRELGERVRSSRACRGGGHRLLRSRAYPVLAGTAIAQPKEADGEVEMIRSLRITRRSALKARALRRPTRYRLCWSALPKG